MDGGRVQLRPLVAYVLLAALASLMMTGAFNADPRHVVQPGALPDDFFAPVSEQLILGHQLSPGAGLASPPVTAPVSASGQPVLVVHPIAQGAASGPSSSAPSSNTPAPSTPTTSAPTTPSATQLQPAKPGKAKGKDKGKGNGHKKPHKAHGKSKHH